MKPRLKFLGIGAAGGAVLLLLFWLLGDVAHVIGLNLQDSSFFLGLVLFLIGLLMVVRGGKSSRYGASVGGYRGLPPMHLAANTDIAMQKEPRAAKDPGEIRKLPPLFMGAGLLNLIVCAITFLF